MTNDSLQLASYLDALDCDDKNETSALVVINDGASSKIVARSQTVSLKDDKDYLIMRAITAKKEKRGSVVSDELSLIFDNCPGQNKNNHVIFLALYLVEREIFMTESILYPLSKDTQKMHATACSIFLK